MGPFAYHYLGRGGFLLLAAVYLAAGPGVPALRGPRAPAAGDPAVDAARGTSSDRGRSAFLPAWLGTFALLGAYGANLASLLHHAPVAGQGLVHHLDPRLISLILVGGIAVLVIGIALWTPWIPRLGPVRQMRRAVPGAWLFSAALLLANHLPHVALFVLLPVAALGILWMAGFGPAAVAYLANCSEAHAADRSALMSFYTVTLAAGGALGAFLGGLAVSLASFDGLVVFGVLLVAITFLLLGRLVRRERGPAASSAV